MEFERPAFTATTFIHVDGLVINRDTGEIYGYDDKPSTYAGRPDYQPELSQCRSADDLSAFLKQVDRRKLPAHTLHSLIDAQDTCPRRMAPDWLGLSYHATDDEYPQQAAWIGAVP